MIFRKSVITAALAGLTVAGCSAIPFRDLYPAHYAEKPASSAERRPLAQLPVEIIASLPIGFQIGAQTGHLACYFDEVGETYFNVLDQSMSTVRRSQAFSDMVSAMREPGRQVFEPLGYPNVVCEMPDRDVRDLFDEGWFGDWLNYLTAWEARALEIEALEAAIARHQAEVTRLEGTLASLAAQSTDYDMKLSDLQSKIDDAKKRIDELKTKLAAAPAASLMVRTDAPPAPPLLPPFDPKVDYKFEKDPFVPVLKDYSKDVSGKAWASDQMEGGKYLDQEMADNIDAFANAVDNPNSVADPALRQKVKDLKARGFSKVSITSGTRSPYRQADLYVKEQRKAQAEGRQPGPVGKYVQSDHMFGQAADMSIPAADGWGYGQPNHNALAEVAAAFGLNFKVKDDKWHVSMTLSHGAQARRVTMMRAYARKAAEIQSAQVSTRESMIFVQDRIFEQQKRLRNDIAVRTNEVQNKASVFANISAAYQELLREEQRLAEQLAERLRPPSAPPPNRSPREPREPREPHFRDPSESKAPPEPQREPASPATRGKADPPDRSGGGRAKGRGDPPDRHTIDPRGGEGRGLP